MQRGDIVTLSLPGDHGKSRPALVVQSDLLQELERAALLSLRKRSRNIY